MHPKKLSKNIFTKNKKNEKSDTKWNTFVLLPKIKKHQKAHENNFQKTYIHVHIRRTHVFFKKNKEKNKNLAVGNLNHLICSK